jgi:hypothetical protein
LAEEAAQVSKLLERFEQQTLAKAFGGELLTCA